MILGGVIGLPAGGIIGGLVADLNLSVFKGALLGFLIIAVPVGGIYLIYDYGQLGNFDVDKKRFAHGLIFIGTVTGIVVSMVTSLFEKGE